MSIKKRKGDDIDSHAKKPKHYIRASSLGNHLMNDGIIDYIQRDHNTNVSLTQQYIMYQGLLFEEELIKIIEKKHIVSKPVFTNETNEEKCNETIVYMQNKCDIIYQGFLFNKKENIGGSPDLIVKSTYINKLMESKILSEKEMYYNGKEYYIIIDIKHSTIHLNGIHIKNVNRIPAYKAQLYIYTKILNAIQNVKRNIAYIWGKEYTNHKNFLNTLGLIDYDTIDKDIIEKTNSAIKHLNNVHSNKTFVNSKQVFPNMKQQQNVIKTEINNSINDITTIWNCGIKHRNIALDHDIDSWKDDKLTANILGFKNERETVINNIIAINKQESDLIRVSNKYELNEMKDTLVIYIDFEGFSEKMKCKIKNGVILDNNAYYIYMIGIGYIDNGFQYKSFILEKTTQSHQNLILTSLFHFLNDLLKKTKKNNIKFYHWSHYERTNFNTLKENVKLCIPDDKYDFVDLCKIYQKHIVIKDCFNFKLKNIALALYKNGLIESKYEEGSDCLDGLDACINALKLYDENINIHNNAVMRSIEKYNCMDCTLLFELHRLLSDLQL